MDLNVGHVVVGLFAVFVANRILNFFNNLKRVNHLPGRRPLFQPFGLPGALFPTTSWTLGVDLHWILRKSLYRDSEVVSIVPWLFGPSSIWCSNLDIARQVIVGSHKSDWVKPTEASMAILVWGMNLVASDGEVWRRHRRVVGPAFNSKLYKFVWDQSVKTYKDMVLTEKWNNEITIPCAQDLTFKYALLLIGKCGFGFNFTWADPPKSQSSSRMSVQESLRTIVEFNALFALAPKWVRSLPLNSLRRARRAHSELDGFMHEQVESRKAVYQKAKDVDDMGQDAFSLLVAANEDSESKFRLSDEELIGNVFVMLFAGHETTAHTLAATIGFLAVHEDIQEEVASEVREVLGSDDNKDPEYEESYHKLIKTASCFFEAVRMFPAGHVLVRRSTTDTVLQIPVSRESEEMKPVPVPKGVDVVVDMVGAQYNPRYFPDPYTYNPSRWYGMVMGGNFDSEVFTGFSVGPRACLGRRFAITEAICFIACLLRDYRIEPLLEEKLKGDGSKETKEEWERRVLDGKMMLTLGVRDVPVKLVRRM